MDNQKENLLYQLARHVRNTKVPSLRWGVEGCELLDKLRDLDPDKFDNEVYGNASKAFLFMRAMTRPRNFIKLDSQEQWEIDKKLGILDWDGSCAHSDGELCPACKKVFRARFGGR
jgi:hypothetical protein